MIRSPAIGIVLKCTVNNYWFLICYFEFIFYFQELYLSCCNATFSVTNMLLRDGASI